MKMKYQILEDYIKNIVVVVMRIVTILRNCYDKELSLSLRSKTIYKRASSAVP